MRIGLFIALHEPLGKLARWKIKLLIVLVAINAGTPCFSQPAAAEPGLKPLSLKEAVATAFQKHPKILAADLQILISKQDLREARSSFFPSIHADATAVGTPTEHNQVVAAGALVSGWQI